MTEVYLLWHIHTDEDLPGGEDVKLIGVYSSEELAVSAKDRMAIQPGFKDQAEGFEISAYTLDKDNWVEGFITVSSDDE
jgi:hypothetical protein